MTQNGISTEMEAVIAARKALARADADAAYWMQQYRQCFEEMRKWVEAAPLDEPDTTPRCRLLQQMLQDTRRGLDYAVRSAAEMRQELANARQFYLQVRTSTHAATSAVAPALTPLATDLLETNETLLREEPCAASSDSPVVPAPLISDPDELQRCETSAPSTTYVSSVRRSTNSEARKVVSRFQPGVKLSPMKRSGNTVYLVPPKRAKYAKVFKWDDNVMHHFPKEFTLPVCTLATMWTYWVCGDRDAKYPPFRILKTAELEDAKTKKSLSSLRFVMLEIESRVLAHGAWVNDPSPKDAANMLDAVKESIATRPAAKRGELQPVEQLQWTSLGRIIRDQKRKMGEEEEEEDDDDEEEKVGDNE